MSTRDRLPFVEPPAPPGCEPVDMRTWEAIGPSFVSGDPDGSRLRLKYFRRMADDRLVGWVWFGPDTQGPPGQAHGGSAAAVLDEAMGLAAWVAGYPVVAARIGVQFRRMIPLGTTAHFEAWVEAVNGKKVHAHGRLCDAHGNPFTTSEGLFIHLPHERFHQMRTEADAGAEARQPNAPRE